MDSSHKQSMAVALNTQRMARKKMSMGGSVPGPSHSDAELKEHSMKGDCMSCGGMCKYYDGGMVMDADDQSMAAMIRRKYAKGGLVDLQDGENEQLNAEDDMSYDAAREDYYDLDQLSDQPEDSNEHGDMIDGDENDKLSKYRKKK